MPMSTPLPSLTVAIGDPNLSQLQDTFSVRKSLAELHLTSSELDQKLLRLLRGSVKYKDAYKEGIGRLETQVDLIREEAEVLEGRLGVTSKTAQRISESVRNLDEENEKIELARVWSEKVEQLKASLLSLASAVAQQDWDRASNHCSQSLEIPEHILHSQFAAAVIPTSELPDPPPVSLNGFRQTLLEVFSRKFMLAIQEKDTIEATRFFTLFPRIGCKREGLSVYSEWARDVVRERGRVILQDLGSGKAESPMHHALLLTQLFEHIALLIDQHQLLVDKHYGDGNFLSGVMPALQEECDGIGEKICDAWWEKRNIKRKLDEMEQYPFDFVFSIGKSSKSLLKGSAVASGSPNLPARSSVHTMDQPRGSASHMNLPQEVDTRELDRIAAEMAAMAARWEVYFHFIKTRFLPKEDEKEDNESSLKSSTGKEIITKDATPVSLPLILESKLRKRIHDILSEVYIPTESWFLRCGIEKAHRLDIPDTEARPYSSALLDDTFYLVRIVLERCVSTSSLRVISQIVRTVRGVVDEDLVQALSHRMDSLWRTSSSSMTVEGPRKDAASREMRTTFVVYLNVLATGARYIDRIASEHASTSNLSQHFSDSDVAKASIMLQDLQILVPRMRSAVRNHTELLFTQLTKPRLRQLLSDSYKGVSYVLDDEAFAEADSTEPFVRRFIRGWDSILVGYKDIFVEENWETYLRMSVDGVARPWEKQAMSMQFSELGALRFDKDLRTVSNYICNQTRVGGLREKFARLTHISYLVNFEEDDVTGETIGAHQTKDAEREGSGADVAWRLSAQEIKQIQARRVGW